MAIAKVIIDGSTKIDVTLDTVSSDYLLSGIRATGCDGVPLYGNVISLTSNDITVSGSLFSIPSGYYSANVNKSAQSGYVSMPNTNISVSPLISVGADGLVTATTSATSIVSLAVNQGYVSSGITGTITISGSSTVQLTSKSATTYIPSQIDQVINSGTFTTGSQKILGDSNLTANNIAEGVSIFGVTGTHVGKYLSVIPLFTSEEGVFQAESNNAYNPISVNCEEIDKKLIDRTFSGSYTNNLLSYIGLYGLAGTNLTYAEFGSCTRLSGYAFTDCSNLQQISLPVCTTIGTGVFKGCCSLETANLSMLSSLVPSYAFYGCSLLRSIDFQITSVQSYGFYGCSSLSFINCLSVTSCSGYAFGRCGLRQAELPLISYVSFGLFEYCESLSFALFESCTYIGSGALIGCINLTDVYAPQCKTVYQNAFRGCTALSYIDLPSCTSVSHSAFMDCYMLKHFSLPNCISINQDAFRNCSSLEEIDIPKGTYIGSGAFVNCSAVSIISMPLSGMPIGNMVSTFSGCTGVTELTTGHTGSPGSSISTLFPNLRKISMSMLSKVYSSGFANNTQLEEVYFPSCTVISGHAFNGCSKLSSICLSPLYSSAGDHAFTNCGLISVTSENFPALITVGQHAFSECSMLQYVSLSGCTQVESYAFSANIALCSVYLPECTSIGYYAFVGDTSLVDVSLPKCSILGANAFKNCTSLSSISLPVLGIVPAYAFQSCSYLERVYLYNCTSIRSYAFFYCYRLVSLYLLGESVVSLESSMYYTFRSSPLNGYSGAAGRLGSIFVRESLYSQYINAARWSQVKSLFVSMTDEEIALL